MVDSLHAAAPKKAAKTKKVDPKKAAKTKKPGTKKKADPYADAILVDGEPPLPADGSFTIAVLPDTQNYSESYPGLFIKGYGERVGRVSGTGLRGIRGAG
jgi:hypothetical protein